MAIVRELIDGRTYETDLEDKPRGTRRFAVLQCTTPHAASVAFEQTAGILSFPGYVDPETGLDRLRLHSYTLTSEGGGAIWYVDAEYAPDLPFTFSKFRYSWAYVKLAQDMPIVKPTIITPTSGNTETNTLLYGFDTLAVSEKRIRRTLTVAKMIDVARGETVYVLDVIAEEIDKLHVLFGALHQFIGADVTPDARDPDLYTIEYTWELDRGTPYPPAPVIQRVGEPFNVDVDIVIRPDRVEGDPPSTLWRPPYSKLIPYSTNPRERPKATTFYPYTINGNGWRRLPGLNVLP